MMSIDREPHEMLFNPESLSTWNPYFVISKNRFILIFVYSPQLHFNNLTFIIFGNTSME